MSGSQAKNARMMQLFADVCGLDVVLPADPAGAVVGGAAMLGRAAYEATEKKLGPGERGAVLWDIMVRVHFHLSLVNARAKFGVEKVEMTPVGTKVKPSASAAEAKLLTAKYKIFREAIDIQKRWRSQMAEASKA